MKLKFSSAVRGGLVFIPQRLLVFGFCSRCGVFFFT
jgi:hypothetical protein